MFGFLAPLTVTAPWDWLPMATFGVLSLLCGTLQWLLPELTGVPMFMYVEDQQRYYSKVKIILFVVFYIKYT